MINAEAWIKMSEKTSTSTRRGPAVLLIDDMIFSTKVAGTARQVGLQTLSHRGVDGLADRLAEADARLLIVDLDFRGGDAIEAITAIRADERLADLVIVAYGSHVAADRLEAADQAGADHVMPRSAFSQHLPRLLSGYAG